VSNIKKIRGGTRNLRSVGLCKGLHVLGRGEAFVRRAREEEKGVGARGRLQTYQQKSLGGKTTNEGSGKTENRSVEKKNGGDGAANASRGVDGMWTRVVYPRRKRILSQREVKQRPNKEKKGPLHITAQAFSSMESLERDLARE